MPSNCTLSRRTFLQSLGVTGAAFCAPRLAFGSDGSLSNSAAEASEDLIHTPLEEFDYQEISLNPGFASTMAQEQFKHTQSVLMSLSEDSLLKPWRLRAGLAAPGPDLGGWYDEVPGPLRKDGHGFAPAHCFGQWISALACGYAITGDSRKRGRVQQLLALYGAAISGQFYAKFRFPSYVYDKMVFGLTQAHRYAQISDAFALLDRTTDAAEPHLPPQALDRDGPQLAWRASVGDPTTPDYGWDEPYTLPENLWIAAELGAGVRYRRMAPRYLLNKTWFDPLAENRNVLDGHHAYSFCNSMSSAMRTYLADGEEKYLRAGTNGFNMIDRTQSFATGGWGPNESFSAPGGGKLFSSLTGTHASFETPCGSYAHFKLTRYLLRVTGHGHYGDSLERVFYNTVLGAKQLESDGHAFYYSDYNNLGRRVYYSAAWPCCSGTLPQVAADYHIVGYFRSPDGIVVNLYLPSTLKTTTPDGAQLILTQSGEYPIEGKVQLNVRLTRASTFELRLRVPGWASSADGRPRITINGERASVAVQVGFARLLRRWADGDRVELELPMPVRLEAIEPEHPSIVALVRGPLVLFAVTDHPIRVTRSQLLAVRRVAGETAWSVQASSGELRMMPFTHLGDNPYATYFDIS